MLTSKSELLELAKNGNLTHEHMVELTQLGIKYLELMDSLNTTMKITTETITEMEPKMPPMTNPTTFKELLNTDVRCPCGRMGELRHYESTGFFVYHGKHDKHNLKRKINDGLKPAELVTV